MRGTRPASTRAVPTILLAVLAGGCATGLHPHETLAGRYFPSHRVAELREGQAPEEVRAVLGEPFEERASPEETVWRYFEEAHPRACSTYVLGLPLSGRPRVTREALVTFRQGHLVKVQLLRDDG